MGSGVSSNVNDMCMFFRVDDTSNMSQVLTD